MLKLEQCGGTGQLIILYIPEPIHCVVFATFAQDMGADVQGAGLLFCFVG
jgi:hypothetical protein